MIENRSGVVPARRRGFARTRLIPVAGAALVLSACTGPGAGPSGAVSTASPTPVAATSSPTAPPEVTPTRFHHVPSIFVIVASGDTLSLIADLYGWSLDAVEAANPPAGARSGALVQQHLLR